LENINNRTTHGWSFFDNHPELGFIETDWLEEYRRKRQEIVRKRIEDYESRGDTLHENQRGGEEETVIKKDAIPKFLSFMRHHLRYHPFKYPSTMPPLNEESPTTSRSIWLRQAMEMHALCKKWKEGYAWEYLWANWYRFDKWILWARAATLDYYPIIQTNAPVEVHWNYLKNRILHYFTHPRIDRLCFEIHRAALPLTIIKIRQYRKGIKDCSWHHKMVSAWKLLEDKIEAEDAEDSATAEQESIDLHDENHPAAQRETRMETMHHTDTKTWSCHCAGFIHSPYHICSHLLRLSGQPYPVKGESVRQHRPPLLFIETFHDPSQRVVCIPSAHLHEIDPPASIEQLGLSQEYLDDLSAHFGGGDEEDPEDYSRVEEDKRKYEEFIKSLRMAADYAEKEMNQSHARFRRLPNPTTNSVKKLVKLAGYAHVLDHGRRRRKTWGRERAGGNMYRN